jgi:S-DNA-T family DNA segregation ATPase FtsK/SpoIIIE
MHASLLGELRRRQRMLREAGNLDNIQQYRAIAQKNPEPMDPMPHLLIIVDEFAELLANRPDFLDLFVTIGRVGRSLGMHLLLATQRLEEGRLKGLESYLRYRICLRTFSAAESSTVLGKPDAYYLPSAPGVGYLKIDANLPLRFKTALISMPYVPAATRISAADQVREFTTTGRLVPCLTPQNSISGALANADQTEMDVVIERLANPALPANRIPVHQVWLPPLPKNLPFTSLLSQSNDRCDGRDQSAPTPGMLCVPVGLLDVPLEQMQMPLTLDFSGAGGHLAVVGAPQSGKSTLLRTLMSAFIATHSPRDVQLYCIDLGGGQLRALESFPHVGAVCTRTDRERIRLLIRLMYKIIADREVLFRDQNIESMATFRMRRQEGELADFPFGDVFLIIDNVAQLQHDFEQLEAEITNLATIGLTYGVHLVLATNRWPEIRSKIRDNIGTRLELRLNDPTESEVDKKKASELPVGVPGRGLTRDKLQFQTFLPWGSAGQEHGSDSQQQAIRVLMEQARSWKGSAAPPVLMLPGSIKRQELLRAEKPGNTGVPIGLEEFRLDPIYIDLLSKEPHFLILGDAECGKTNLLRLWWSELTRRYTPAQVRIAAIECRSTINLFDITKSEHYLTYASMRMPSSLKESVDCLIATFKERALSTSYTSIRELASARTWTGPHYFLFVDDYDAIVSPAGTPLAPLRDLIIQARDIGFHVVLARSVSGISSTSYEQVVKALREQGGPGLIMSGERQEGKLLHEQTATSLPPGRGYLVRKKYPPTQVQIALA